MITILLIAVSLALDAFAVSVSSGISVPGFGWRQAVKMGTYFGGFQFAMPLIGWFLGSSVSRYIEAVDHWVAFGLLAFIGGRMIFDTLREKSRPAECRSAEFTLRTLLMQSVATSIDALAVGITLAFLKVNIWAAASFIGVTTFIISAAGVKIGHVFGEKYTNKAELAGGLILMGIGVKILLEHLGVINF